MDPSVRAYLASVPDGHRDMIETLHALIIDTFPDAQVSMQYRMPTYWLGDDWVALANQKRYVSLYTCGQHHIVEFKHRHPKIRTGKGCINFGPRDPLPLDDIRAVVRHAIMHPKAR